MSTNQTPNLRVTVAAHRNMFGKLNKHAWTANLGDTGIYAQGTCRQGAIEQLYADLCASERNRRTRRYIRVPGAIFALYWADGWCYDIIRDADPANPSTSLMQMTVRLDDALAKMQEHARQWAECQ